MTRRRGWERKLWPGNKMIPPSPVSLLDLQNHPPIPLPQHHHNHIIAIMKGTTFLATAIAAGTASAGVHKMPLKKVPLSKQLVSSIA
jgi:hypothetical protein